MSPNSSPPCRFRLQFTLRTILLGFVVVSLALVIYRWPWEETTNEWREDKTVTTFRRSWDGSKVRHGPEKLYRLDDKKVAHLALIRDYVDGEHVSDSIVNRRGVAIAKAHLKDEERHGPFFDEHTHLHLSGQYENGDRVGNLNYRYGWQGETVSVLQQFENDHPTGMWRWRSAAGHELQSATFQEGKLVAWNNQPAAEALKSWCDANALDAPTRVALNTPIDRRWQEIKEVERWIGSRFAKVFEWGAGTPDEQQLLHFRIDHPGYEFSVDPSYEIHEGAGRPFLHVLLEKSLQESRIPVYRYGVIWIVPIAESELDWRDCSHVAEVSFAPGSSQDEAWQAAVVETLSLEDKDFEWRFQSLFVGTSIQIDASEFRLPTQSQLPMAVETWRSLIFSPAKSVSMRPRPRRDILGFLLSSHGWSCELSDNVLILHPYPAE